MAVNSKKVAAVTGAGQGIGEEIAALFAASGYQVALIDINREKVERAAGKIGRGAAPYLCDVTDEGQVRETLDLIINDLGRLDVLINNAGILMRGFVEEFTAGDLRKILEVNLLGVYNCCRYAVKIMKKQQSGVILNAASIVNKQYDVGLAGYCISKKGVEVLTKILAGEAAPYGIRVNAYAPGTAVTPMTEQLIKTRGESKVKQIPLGRFARPVDIAEACLFLASEAARHITGTVLEVDGGELVVQRPQKALEHVREKG